MTQSGTDASRVDLKSLEPQEVLGLLFAIHYKREQCGGRLPEHWRPQPIVPPTAWCPPMAYARQYGVAPWPSLAKMTEVLYQETDIACYLVDDELRICGCDELMIADLRRSIDTYIAQRKEMNVIALIASLLLLHLLSWMVLLGWPLTFLAEKHDSIRVILGILIFWTFPSFIGVYMVIERRTRRALRSWKLSAAAR